MLKVVLCTAAVVLCAAASARASYGASSQEPAASRVARFHDAVRGASTPEARAEMARAYVRTLEPRDQLALARALVIGNVQEDALLGADLLVEREQFKDAAPAFARFVIAGGDMTAFFWQWIHGEDTKRAPRAYIAIARAVLARIDGLAGERRKAAETFLLDAGYGPAIATYSRAAVEAKLAALEREIR